MSHINTIGICQALVWVGSLKGSAVTWLAAGYINHILFISTHFLVEYGQNIPEPYFDMIKVFINW